MQRLYISKRCDDVETALPRIKRSKTQTDVLQRIPIKGVSDAIGGAIWRESGFASTTVSAVECPRVACRFAAAARTRPDGFKGLIPSKSASKYRTRYAIVGLEAVVSGVSM